jgi:hypothetical protein
MPGEEAHHDAANGVSGGTEQFMHCTGTLVLDGQTYSIDCNPIRDRSWCQVRTERRAVVEVPPIGWSPMYFGPDLAVNQVGWEHTDTDPAWAGLYAPDSEAPTHHFGYVLSGESILAITDVRRNVLEYDPLEFMPLRQELDVRDEAGKSYRFVGTAIALCPVPAWPNVMAHDSVYRWEDERGRLSYGPYQEVWSEAYQHAMRDRHRRMARESWARSAT